MSAFTGATYSGCHPEKKKNGSGKINFSNPNKVSEKKLFQKNANLIWFPKLINIQKYLIKLSQSQNHSYRFVGFNDWISALELIKTGECIYEDFLECKPYLDCEYKCPLDEYLKNKTKYDEVANNRLCLMYEYTDNAMKILTNNGDYTILMTKSHGEVTSHGERFYKFSFHFVVDGLYRFRNSSSAVKLANIIKNNESGSDVIDMIDMSVYKKNPESLQKFRCVYSYKTADDTRILEPIDVLGNIIKDVEISDYLVSYRDQDNTDIIYLSSDFDQNNEKPNNDTKRDTKHNDKHCDKHHGNNNNKNNENKKTKHVKTSSAINKIMIEILRKVIPSVHCNDVSVNDCQISYYPFNYDHKKHCCIHGNKSHDHIGGYAYIKDGVSVYAGCYSNKCKDKGSIFVSNILDTSYWENNNNVVKINSQFILKNKKGKDIINSFSNQSEDKILCIKSEMATGKTFALNTIISRHIESFGEKSRIIAISTRRSYAQDAGKNVFNTFNFSNYMKCMSDLNDIDRLIISLESLHKLYNNDTVKYYDMVILDEVESIIAQFFSNTVTHNHECFDKFCELLKYSKKL